MAKIKLRPDQYWETRSLKRTLSSEKLMQVHAKKIDDVYLIAQSQVQADIDRLYRNYLKADGVLDIDSLLKSVSPQETAEFWKQMKAKGHLEYITGNYKARLNRLEVMQGQIYDHIASIRNPENAIQTASHVETINNAYQQTVFDTSQGVAQNIAPFGGGIDQGTMNTMLNTQWQGNSYSSRIWGNTNTLGNMVSSRLNANILTGKSPTQLSRDLQEQFNVGRSVANRLIRTENAYYHNNAEYEAHKDMGLDEYVFMATLDTRTSEVCQEHDHKKYKLKDKRTGENYPPLHPNCRSTTRAFIGDEYEPDTRIARDEDGNSVQIQDMNYQEWKRLNEVVDIRPSHQPVPVPPTKTVTTVNSKNEMVKKTIKQTDTLPMPVTRTRMVNEELASVVREGVTDVQDRYPQAFSRLEAIRLKTIADSAKNRGLAYGGVNVTSMKRVGKMDGSFAITGIITPQTRVEIKIPNGANDVKKWASHVRRNNKSGWWSTDNPKAVIYHELGHSLDRVMGMQQADVFGDFDKLVALGGKRVNLKQYRPMISRLNKGMGGHVVGDDIINRTLKEVAPAESKFSAIKKNVSNYANEGKHGHAEAFAELFAKHMNGDTDDITKVFGRNLDAKLKELKLL